LKWVLVDGDIYICRIDESTVLKLYPDNRPNNLETSPLQKGVVIEHEGEELVGEGMGFGVPLVNFRDKTYFPGSSHITLEANSITKVFILDTVSKKYYKGNQISDRIYRPFHKAFTFFYLRVKSLRFLFDLVMKARESSGIETSFIKVAPRGQVSVRYSVTGRDLDVAADFKDIEREKAEELVVLNEQGAAYYVSYSDSDGAELHRERIGAWDKVEARKAYLTDEKRKLSFNLSRLERGSLFRGYEDMPGRLSWVGLNYTFEPGQSLITFKIGLGEPLL
jgi:hypothetical protein